MGVENTKDKLVKKRQEDKSSSVTTLTSSIKNGYGPNSQYCDLIL